MSCHSKPEIGKGKARQVGDSDIRDYGTIELSKLSKQECTPYPSIDGIMSASSQGSGPSSLTHHRIPYCKTHASSSRAGQSTGDIADERPQSVDHDSTNPHHYTHPHTDDPNTAHTAPSTDVLASPLSNAPNAPPHEGSWYTKPLDSAKAFGRPIRRAIENNIEDPFERRKTQVYTSLHRSIQPRLPRPPEDCCGPKTTIPGMCYSCCYTTCGCEKPPAHTEESVAAEASTSRHVQYSWDCQKMSYCSPSEECLLPCSEDDGSRCTKGYQD